MYTEPASIRLYYIVADAEAACVPRAERRTNESAVAIIIIIITIISTGLTISKNSVG